MMIIVIGVTICSNHHKMLLNKLGGFRHALYFFMWLLGFWNSPGTFSCGFIDRHESVKIWSCLSSRHQLVNG